jgi:hypothetical protein
MQTRSFTVLAFSAEAALAVLTTGQAAIENGGAV